jgi:hypothetical protein
MPNLGNKEEKLTSPLGPCFLMESAEQGKQNL